MEAVFESHAYDEVDNVVDDNAVGDNVVDDNAAGDNAVDDNAVDDVATHPADVEPALSSADISQNKLLAGGVGYQHLVIKVVISTWLSKPLQ